MNVKMSMEGKRNNYKNSNSTNVVALSHLGKVPAVNCVSMFAGEVKQETEKHREVKFIKPAIPLSNSYSGVNNSLLNALHGAKHEHLDFSNKRNKRSSISVNVMEICEQFSSYTLTDFEAESIMSPFVAIHTRELIDMLLKQLEIGVQEIQWSLSPTAHESWLFDLRFYGDWWLTLLDYTVDTNDINTNNNNNINSVKESNKCKSESANINSCKDDKREEEFTPHSFTDYTESHNERTRMISEHAQGQRSEKAKRVPVISIIDQKIEKANLNTKPTFPQKELQYQQDQLLQHDNSVRSCEEDMTALLHQTKKPLLSAEDVNDEACVNALLADLTLRLRGPLFHFEMLHLDHFDLTPERIHVLFFKGIFLHEEKYSKEIMQYEKSNCSKDVNWYEHVYCSDYAKACHALLSNKCDNSNSENIHRENASVDNNKEIDISNYSERCHRTCDSSNGDDKKSVNNDTKEDNINNDENAINYVDKVAASVNKSMEQNNLTTLSFSICNISSASLMILLLSLISAKRLKSISVTHLDLSYNALSEHSLRCFARLLPMTSITHLSVRGNCLDGRDSRTFHDFLRIGCAHLEELDLCFTHLSSEQIGILIECLPTLSHLRVLLLDGVNISSDKAPLLTKAVARSRLCKISLYGSFAADANTYVSLMHHKCEQHSKQYSYQMSSSSSSLHVRKLSQSQSAMSFFEQFFVQSLSRG